MTDPKENPKESVVDFGRNPFEFKIAEPYSVLKLFGAMGADLAKEFEKRIRPQFENFAGDLVLDLTECTSLHASWSRPLMGIAAIVKKAEKRIRVVTTNADLRTFLHDAGIGASFPVVPDLSTAAAELSAKKAVKLDVEFINPFLDAAVTVLKKQTGTLAKPGHLQARGADAPLDGDISGVIPLKSESFSGAVVISFPTETFVKIVSQMLGEPHAAITPENQDAASELSNQIFGYAKVTLNEKGHRIQMAIPKVVTGRKPDGLPPSHGPRIAIPFESDSGPFTVEIRV